MSVFLIVQVVQVIEFWLLQKYSQNTLQNLIAFFYIIFSISLEYFKYISIASYF